MVRKSLLAAAAIVTVASAAAVQAGGWTVITLKNVPTHAWVGGGLGVIYTVRQHGQTPMNDLAGRIEARKGPTVVRAEAKPLWGGRLEDLRTGRPGVRSPGAYVVNIQLPEPGTWTVDLIAGSGLVGDTLTMTIDVLPQGTDEPDLSAVERGSRLFEGKGCVTCHNHPAFGGRKSVNLSDMADKRYTPEFVRAFLESLPRGDTTATGARMPNLGLAGDEIDALAAFLGR